MKFESVLAAASNERLYPAVILYGANSEARQEAAVALARCVLCERPPGERPCGDDEPCRHCSRLGWPPALFHPDFHVLGRDLRTATSTDATKRFLAGAYAAPFEARGQVYVIAEADSLAAGASDSLLKILEEPPPRVIFAFATTEPQKIEQGAAPVMSRCQRFDFRRVSVGDITARLETVLEREGVEAEPGEKSLGLIEHFVSVAKWSVDGVTRPPEAF